MAIFLNKLLKNKNKKQFLKDEQDLLKKPL